MVSYLELETTIQILSDITNKIYRLIKFLSNSATGINSLTGITRQALVKDLFVSIDLTVPLPISITGLQAHLDLRIEDAIFWLILIGKIGLEII